MKINFIRIVFLIFDGKQALFFRESSNLFYKKREKPCHFKDYSVLLETGHEQTKVGCNRF